jgi:hypothetical protein
MRWLAPLILTALLGMFSVACGRGSRAVRATATTSINYDVSRSAPTMQPMRDGDKDKPGNSYYDKDDAEIVAYGHAASVSDRQQVVALVERYFAVAAAGDGAAGCGLMYGLFSEEVVEEDGQPPGPPSLRGTTCPEVMSKLFKQDRQQLMSDAKLGVTGARVSGDRGYALLGNGARTEGSLLIHREAGSWKVEAVVESGLP